jgi:BirA family biotin operon repressor/biotin-[acetyl-CoA-carboxylase] ligase
VTSNKPRPGVLHFESLDSTNDEALRQLAAGNETPLWIVGRAQTRGRGRGGRQWSSPQGNLYASLLLKTTVDAATATQLSFVAALAAHDAIAEYLLPERQSTLRLKWPNDVMLGGAKIAGVLLESLAAPKGGSLAVVLGFGINVSQTPHATGRAVACLDLDPQAVPKVFATLAHCLETWLIQWKEGEGFPFIRESWLRRAMALNESISVNLNGSSIRGRFCGVDPAGALQLETEPGVVITVTAGDIYPEALT